MSAIQMAFFGDASPFDWTTTLVAWWGAGIATFVLLWDIYKWRHEGPKIKMKVLTGMKTIGNEELEGKTLIIAEVTNIGDRATTLTKLAFAWYPNRWCWLRGKPTEHFVVKNPGRDQSFPHRLEVGNTWNGFTSQGAEIEQKAQDGLLYCQLYCSSQNHPISQRVVIDKQNAGPRHSISKVT